MTRVALALLLLSRLALFALAQAGIALALAATGDPHAWRSSERWWIPAATLANLASIGILVSLLHREGARYRDLLRFERATRARDIGASLLILLAAGAVTMLPAAGLSILLWGDAAAGSARLVARLPTWTSWGALVLFPLTIALSELPTYYGYVLPRLRQRVGVLTAVLVTAAALSIQHATLPILLDARFALWRGLEFFPLALVLGAALAWRPRLLPYLALAHGLLDAVTVWTVLF